jgi:xanthine dehydrogenase FAD-binding subunit
VKNFKLINPSSKQEALIALAKCGSEGKLLAGGTDLMPRFREDNKTLPEFIINLKSISDFKEISIDNSKITVGALATHSEVIDSPVIIENALVLAEACDKIASWQIRNMATLGGNLANASPAADSAPALLVLDATISLLGPERKRELKLEEFFKGPGKTALANDEIIEHVSFIALNDNEGAAFIKLGKRKAMTLSIVSAAAYVKISADRSVIKEAKLAMGAVAPIPLRVKSAEAVLKGFDPVWDDWSVLHEAVKNDIKPINDMRSSGEYRLRVAAFIAERAVKTAIARAVKNEVGIGGN